MPTLHATPCIRPRPPVGRAPLRDGLPVNRAERSRGRYDVRQPVQTPSPLPLSATRGEEQPTFDAAALLGRIAESQDRGAFAALFRHYAPRVKGHLMGRGIAAGLAEEITQEVMLTIWRKAGAFDPARGAPGTWIFTIARNCLVSHLRRDQRPEVDPDDPLAVPEHAPDEALIGEEARRALGAALRTLPPEQAEVIDAAYFHDRTFGEVAAAKQLPLGTVKTRARLALERLRAVFSRGEER